MTKCTLTVDLLAVSDQDNGIWRKLWAAAVAINTMCVRKGKSGISRGQGRSPLPSIWAVPLLTARGS